MTRADVAGGVIRIVQTKTGNKAVVPIHRDLKPTLDASPSGAQYLLETAAGRSAWRATASGCERRTERPRCRTSASRTGCGGRRRPLAEAGASTKQIMAILGLKSLALAELYARDAKQEHLAAGGMTAWEGRATG